MPILLRGAPLTGVQISGILRFPSCFLCRAIQLRACSIRSPVVASSGRVFSNLLLWLPRTTIASILSSFF